MRIGRDSSYCNLVLDLQSFFNYFSSPLAQNGLCRFKKKNNHASIFLSRFLYPHLGHRSSMLAFQFFYPGRFFCLSPGVVDLFYLLFLGHLQQVFLGLPCFTLSLWIPSESFSGYTRNCSRLTKCTFCPSPTSFHHNPTFFVLKRLLYARLATSNLL